MRQWMLAAGVSCGLLLGVPGFSGAQGLPPLPDTKMNLDAATKFLNSQNPKDRAFGLVTMDYLGAKAQGASPLVVQAMFDPNADVRKYAAAAITKVDPAIGPSVVALVNGTDYQAQLNALQTLAKLGPDGAAAVPALLNFLEKDKARPEDRAALVASLASIGAKDPGAAKALANVALTSDDPALRKTAIQSLGKMDAGPSAMPQFMTALNGGNPAAQQLAIQALGVVGAGNPEVAQVLKKVAANDPSPKVREAAQKAVADLSKPKKP